MARYLVTGVTSDVARTVAEALATGLPADEATEGLAPEIAGLLGLDSAMLAEVYENLPQRMSLEQLQAGRA